MVEPSARAGHPVSTGDDEQSAAMARCLACGRSVPADKTRDRYLHHTRYGTWCPGLRGGMEQYDPHRVRPPADE